MKPLSLTFDTYQRVTDEVDAKVRVFARCEIHNGLESSFSTKRSKANVMLGIRQLVRDALWDGVEQK